MSIKINQHATVGRSKALIDEHVVRTLPFLTADKSIVQRSQYFDYFFNNKRPVCLFNFLLSSTCDLYFVVERKSKKICHC